MSQVDFIFDGPVASRSPNGQQTITPISTTTVTSRNQNSRATTPQSVTQYNACIDSCPVIIF